jgi:hypothetical protein
MKRTTQCLLVVLLVWPTIGCQLAVNFDRDKIPAPDSGAITGDNPTPTDETSGTAAVTHTVPTEDKTTPPTVPNEEVPIIGDRSDASAAGDADVTSTVDGETPSSSDANIAHSPDAAVTPPKTATDAPKNAAGDAGYSCAGDTFCEQSQYCSDGNACAARLVNESNAACSRDRQCAHGGGCCEGRCVSLSNEAHCGASAGDGQKTCGSVCAEGQYCDRSDCACALRLDNGKSCGRDKECKSNGCCNSQCISLSQDKNCGRAGCGQECNGNQYCYIDTCIAKAEYNAACLTGNQCLSDACVLGYCGCEKSNDCKNEQDGHLCLNAVCGCENDGDCAERWRCDTAAFTCKPPPPPPNDGSRPPPR